MKFCPNCGAELKAEAKFCSSCGTPLTPQAPKPQPQAQAAPEKVVTSGSTRVINIYGYKEYYMITPEVDVFLNNRFIGKVAANSCLPVELTDDNAYFEFRLKAAIGFPRKCHCFVNKTFTGGLQLKTNRLFGTISVDYVM